MCGMTWPKSKQGTREGIAISTLMKTMDSTGVDSTAIITPHLPRFPSLGQRHRIQACTSHHPPKFSFGRTVIGDNFSRGSQSKARLWQSLSATFVSKAVMQAVRDCEPCYIMDPALPQANTVPRRFPPVSGWLTAPLLRPFRSRSG